MSYMQEKTLKDKLSIQYGKAGLFRYRADSFKQHIIQIRIALEDFAHELDGNNDRFGVELGKKIPIFTTNELTVITKKK